MSTIDTSIQRPYFRKQEYPRVVDTGFNELTRTISDTQVEDLINEYRKIANSLPPEIHADIARNSGAALGIDIDEEDFDEINRLNNLLDELEGQDIQEQTIDSREHPHYRNGSFIKGWTYRPSTNADFDNLSEEELDKNVAYYYMQQGYKRQIIDKTLFEILYTLRTKNNNYKSIPFCEPETLAKIQIAKPITYEIGKETSITDITELPPQYLDASSTSAVIQRYKTSGNTVPETTAIIQQTYIDLDKFYKNENDSEKQETLNRISNPPPRQ
jgi:hypothetical protein